MQIRPRTIPLALSLIWKLHSSACRAYGAVAVTCWDGGDTLSLTKEINFPVT